MVRWVGDETVYTQHIDVLYRPCDSLGFYEMILARLLLINRRFSKLQRYSDGLENLEVSDRCSF